MRIFLLLVGVIASSIVFAQEERDTVLKRCPIYIMDTVSSNNYFIEYQPSTLKVYRVKGDLHISIQQKDQFFTLFFNDKKLKNDKYKIVVGESKKDDEVEAKYS